MSGKIFRSALAIATLAMIGTFTTTETASAQTSVRVAPYVNPGATPRLGFTGRAIWNWGMHVDQVYYGSTAARQGLERGDVIMSINGRRINSMGDYFSALSAANYQGGWISMVVDNVRARQTGREVGTARGA